MRRGAKSRRPMAALPRARSCRLLRAARLGDQRFEVVVDGVAQRMPEAAPARRGKTLGDEGARPGIFAQHEGAHLFVAEIGVVQRPRSARPEWRPVVSAKPISRSTVSANSDAPRGPCRIWPSMKRGLVARARTTRVTASVTERGRGFSGSVVSSMMTSALPPSSGDRRRKAADEGDIGRSFEDVAAGIVAGVDQQVGLRHPSGEGAGRRKPFAFRAAIGMRGRVEIGAAEFVARSASRLPQEGPPARRRRCRATSRRCAAARCLAFAPLRRAGFRTRPRRARRPPWSAASISAIWVGNMSRNRPEMRQVTSMRGRPTVAGGSTSMPVTRPVAASHCGRQPISASPCAISSPPVRSEAEPQRSTTSERGQSP